MKIRCHEVASGFEKEIVCLFDYPVTAELPFSVATLLYFVVICVILLYLFRDRVRYVQNARNAQEYFDLPPL